MRFVAASTSGGSVVGFFGTDVGTDAAADLVVKGSLQGSPATEIRAQKMARKAGATAVVACAALDGFGFLQEVQRGQPKQSWSDDDVAAVGVALARLHALGGEGLPPLAGGAALPAVFNEARRVLHGLVKRGVVSGADATAIDVVIDGHAAAAASVIEFGGGDERALCHGDVRADNVFFDDGVARFIDFGLAGRGDPAIDVARTAAQQRLSDHQLFVLVDAWAHESGDDGGVDRAVVLARAMPVVLTLSALRYAKDVADGDLVVVDAGAVVGRVAGIAERLSRAVGREIAVTVPVRR